MKLGKHVEGANRGVYSDRISSLPDEVLGHILSVLPTRCAVCTSTLSTRWKYLYTLTNCLSFNYTPCWDESDDDEPEDDESEEGETKEEEVARERRFKKFVSNVLELHQVSPIEKFSLVCQDTYEKFDLTAWISKAVQKGVRDLHCEVGVRNNVLPDGLFMSQTLVRFKMSGFFVHTYELKIPLSAWLPSLKVLHLDRILFLSHESVERLFTGCEMLEELTLKHCGCDDDDRCQIVISPRLLKILTIEDFSFEEGLLEIDAPNLARLSFINNTGIKIVLSWKDSCSLAKAELSFGYDEEDIALIKAAADKITELHLGGNSVLRVTLAGHEEMPDFCSLSTLHLSDCPFTEWKAVTRLLDKSPQLETFTFQECLSSETKGGDVDVSPPNEELMPFSCHAKVIELYGFYGDDNSLLYIRHLLKNAGVLKKLILHRHRHYGGSTACRQQIVHRNMYFDVLWSLPRASKKCCIKLKNCAYN